MISRPIRCFWVGAKVGQNCDADQTLPRTPNLPVCDDIPPVAASLFSIISPTQAQHDAGDKRKALALRH
jgi:hypothetical protein